MTDLLEKFSEVHGTQASSEEFLEMFNNAMMALNEKYQPGTFDFVFENHKEHFQKIEKLEGELGEVWDKDLEAFREILKRYYFEVLDCIRLHRESISMSQPAGPEEGPPGGVLAGCQPV